MELIPRPEHPNPQWKRDSFINLNGKWEFDFDFGKSAIDRELHKSDAPLSKEIIVPFCPESELSGIGYKDFLPAVCYKKKFTLAEKDISGSVFLNIGAADYETKVFVNGNLAGTHKGGYDSFKFDITPFANVGENTVFIYVEDDPRSELQPRGKQCCTYYSVGCDYTRTTGIWQTVYLECVPKNYIKYAKYICNTDSGTIYITGETNGKGDLKIESSFNGKNTGGTVVKCYGGHFSASFTVSEKHLWDVGKGNLYDLVLSFGEDTVYSYFGMRDIRMDEMKFMLNGKSVFQRLVLDQGFYPDGIYTAPSEEALIRDIKISLDAGFNGARLHQKIFEPRFLYHCDKMGYLVWEEHANWGLDHNNLRASEIFLNEWQSIISRDFNHPSIIGWCPFNETAYYVESCSKTTLLSIVYNYTKAVDPTRPVIDASGFYHAVTDIYDVHDYEQDPAVFAEHYNMMQEKSELYDLATFAIHRPNCYQKYNGEPVFMSEYGGIRWTDSASAGWGYGNAPETKEEFLSRYKGLTEAILFNKSFMGFCYTQLYDIEQEINGLYTYDRKPKFDMNIISAVNKQKAAIE